MTDQRPNDPAGDRSSDRPWPTELRLSKDRRTLTVSFEGGESFALPAEYLRVKSPSAEVQGHSPDERKTVPGKRNVAILEVDPIGNYAARLTFDDMHSTGIFTWDYLLAGAHDYTSDYWRTLAKDFTLSAAAAQFRSRGAAENPLRSACRPGRRLHRRQASR